MPDDDDPEKPTTALRELFLIERATGVPVGPTPTYPVLLADPDAPGALRAALIGVRSLPALLVVDRPKAAEPAKPEEPIAVILPVAVGRVGRGVGHTPMCRLLDAPARKRGWKFVCICGRDRPR